ncbi:unnamed protein product [Eretmochelys imbricata]
MFHPLRKGEAEGIICAERLPAGISAPATLNNICGSRKAPNSSALEPGEQQQRGWSFQPWTCKNPPALVMRSDS